MRKGPNEEQIRLARSTVVNVPDEMKVGMRELLEIHTMEELWFLNEKLNLHHEADVDKIIAEKLNSREDYKNMLGFIWEGIITEHLKSKGRHVRQHKDNPRRMIYKHWLRGEEEYQIKKDFEALYLPQLVRPESMEDYTHDPTTIEYLNKLKEKELVVKEFEMSIRKKIDHRNVLSFFDSLAKLRFTEEEGRKILIETVNEWKSKVDTLNYRMEKAECIWRIMGTLSPSLSFSFFLSYTHT